MREIIVFGATSDMARAIVREFAENKHLFAMDKTASDNNASIKNNFQTYETDNTSISSYNGVKFILCARDLGDLEDFSKDIWIRSGVLCECCVIKLDDFATHRDLILSFENLYGVIYVAGFMPNQKKAQKDFSLIKQSVEINLLCAMSVIEVCAEVLEQKKEGFIIGVSSVAGDRGRASNYIYGCAKAGFSAYLEGVSNRFGLLKDSKVRVLCVKPGFVYTKMTAHLQLPPFLSAMPREVARDILRSLCKNSHICYTKSIWRWIMFAVRNIPHWLFKKMKL